MAPSLPACGQMGKCDNGHQGQVPVTPPGTAPGHKGVAPGWAQAPTAPASPSPPEPQPTAPMGAGAASPRLFLKANQPARAAAVTRKKRQSTSQIGAAASAPLPAMSLLVVSLLGGFSGCWNCREGERKG